MSELDTVLARAKDWNSRRGQLSGSLASLRKYDAEGAQLLRKLTAALDAARGEAVATVQTITSLVGETRKVIIGKTEVIDALPVGTAVFAAPPAALAVPAWTEAQLREEAKARGWHVREGRSVPTPDGEWRHPFEVTIPSRDLCAMLTQQPAAAAVPEGVARDAARYRWLRNDSGNAFRVPVIHGAHFDSPERADWLTGEHADAAIDAMKETP